MVSNIAEDDALRKAVLEDWGKVRRGSQHAEPRRGSDPSFLRQSTPPSSSSRTSRRRAARSARFPAWFHKGNAVAAETATLLLTPPFSFVLTACAAAGNGIDELRIIAGLPSLKEGSLLAPSLHLVGVEDPFKLTSEKAATLFAARQIAYMPGGHAITRIERNDAELCGSVRWLVTGDPTTVLSEHIWTQVSDITTLSMRKDVQVWRWSGSTSPGSLPGP